MDPERGRSTHREFSRDAALALLGGAVVSVYGCGGGSEGSGYSSPTSPSTPSAGDTATSPGDAVGSISSNHGHSALITAAQLTAGNGLRLDIRGQATHSHVVDLTGPQVVLVRGGSRVSVDSTDSQGHTHRVDFNGQADDGDTGY